MVVLVEGPTRCEHQIASRHVDRVAVNERPYAVALHDETERCGGVPVWRRHFAAAAHRVDTAYGAPFSPWLAQASRRSPPRSIGTRSPERRPSSFNSWPRHRYGTDLTAGSAVSNPFSSHSGCNCRSESSLYKPFSSGSLALNCRVTMNLLSITFGTPMP